jgi:protein-L-isoaspartate(D-aspartate) O-methyltransferase
MVDALAGQGISDRAVLDALRRVPRHRFVPPSVQDRAYDDTPLPIGFEQTISAPFIVAYMTQALQVTKADKVLEIGTGSGYQAAILAELARDVFTIEIVPQLATRAASTLGELGYKNLHPRTGNGYLGWPEEAPFTRIIVTAAPEQVPPALVAQLAVGGVMVLPVGTDRQRMLIIRKRADGTTVDETIPVRFVPMVNRPPTWAAPR